METLSKEDTHPYYPPQNKYTDISSNGVFGGMESPQ